MSFVEHDRGSIYIQSLVRVLAEDACELDMLAMLTKVRKQSHLDTNLWSYPCRETVY